MKLMMMVIRMMRIKMMMAILCFPLTLPPWSELFYIQSCLLQYIQLSSADQWVLPCYSILLLSHGSVLHIVQHCSRAEYTCILSFHLLPGLAAEPSHALSNQHCTCSPYGSSDDTFFWASLCSTAHTMLLTQVIWITRINGGKSL